MVWKNIWYTCPHPKLAVSESMSKNERKCFIRGLLMIRLPFCGSQFQPLNNGEGLFWVTSSGKIPKPASLSHTSQTSLQPSVLTWGTTKNRWAEQLRAWDAEKPVDASVELGPPLMPVGQWGLGCPLGYVFLSLQSWVSPACCQGCHEGSTPWAGTRS